MVLCLDNIYYKTSAKEYVNVNEGLPDSGFGVKTFRCLEVLKL